MKEQKENNKPSNSNKPFSTGGKIIYLTILIGLIIGTTITIASHFKNKSKEIAVITPVEAAERLTKDTTITAAPLETTASISESKTGDPLADEVAGKFNIKITVQSEGGDSTGITINVSKNKKPDKIIKYEGAHFPVALDLNSYYLLKFSKTGFITKAVYVNTKIPKGREKDDFARFIMDVVLKKKTKDKSSDYINFVGGIKYDTTAQDFDKVND